MTQAATFYDVLDGWRSKRVKTGFANYKIEAFKLYGLPGTFVSLERVLDS